MRLFAVLSFALVAAWPAAAQDALPPGPGRDETLKACGGCHGVESFLGIRRTREQWEITIDNMINWGAKIDDADYDTVAAYLAANLGPAPPPPTPAKRPPARSP